MERSSLSGWFNQFAEVYYVMNVDDKAGGIKKSWEKKYSRMPCRTYGVPNAKQSIEIQGIQYLPEKKMICSVEYAVLKGDKLTIESNHFMVLRSEVMQTRDAHHVEILLGRMEE